MEPSGHCKATMEEEEMGSGAEEEAGRRMPMRKADPKEPTEEERRIHEFTHLPFRNWCRHCVRGRGKEEPCRKSDADPRVPEIHMDFMFMGEEGGGRTLAFLVARQRGTKAVMCSVAPRKSSGEWLAARVLAFMREFGCELEAVTIKTDNEPAMVALVDALGRLRAAKGGISMAVENSPVHSSKSNGVVERAVQSVQGMIRTMRSALEEKWKVKLEADHVVWSWMAEYAGWLLTRGEVGHDGKTAWERSRGKEAKIPGMEFGEGVLWKRRREGGPLGKLSCMWDDGVFLGVKGTTGEYIIGDVKGVWRTRTVRRKPESERWSRKNIGRVVATPWKMKVDEAGDGEEMRTAVRVMDKDYVDAETREAHEKVPRNVYIRVEDLDRLGYTMGCPGCKSILRKTTRQQHSESCRRRVEDELKETDKLKAAKKKMGEYLEKKMKEDTEMRSQKKRKSEGIERDEGDETNTGMEDIKVKADIEVEGDGMDEKVGTQTTVRAQAGSSGSSGDAAVKRKAETDEVDADERLAMKFLKKLDRASRKRERESRDDGRGNGSGEIGGVNEMYVVNEEDEQENHEGMEEEWDDEELDPEQVERGRSEEVEFMVNKLNMFEFGDYDTAVARGKKEPTTTKWVEGWKSDDKGGRFVRCRLVGRDFKGKERGGREDLFAAMPPLEAKKMVFRKVAAERWRRKRSGEKEVKLMFIDVRKAHLNAICDEEEWVELPAEFWRWGRFARLRRWLYGMRKAAAGWEEDYSRRLAEVGFKRGRGAPTVFVNEKTGVRLVVHGDDFTFSGERGELEKMKVTMAEWYEIKDRGIMGSEMNEQKEVTILGRTVRWTEAGIEYEADERHRRELLKMAGLDEGSNAVVGPCVKEEEDQEEWESMELNRDEAREFRGAAARMNYLGQDRSDIQFATKLVCQSMSRPTAACWRRIKRVARYLVGAKKVVWKYGDVLEENGDNIIDVYVDSDWAGAADRKSTSGGMVAVGGVGVKHWSRTQKSRALSSPEAEYYALVTGAAEGLGMQSLAEDLGWKMEVRVWTDSSGAKAVAGRRGLGRLRHVELKYLWVQDVVREGRLRLRKIRGELNVADHLTKPKGRSEMGMMMEKVGAYLEVKEN